ncbi:MAG: Gfo/Idh/MocA family oxidoreductase [Cytophagales bacterium]|nr:Gfo/Idh/MocA family oxidoreductase [Cytophagales bacterium]
MKKVAVVGFGFMGMTHAGNILKNDKLELVAIVDTDVEGIAKKISSGEGNFSAGSIDPGQLRNVNKYKTLTDCIANEEMDAVHICVHTDLHFSLAREAMTAGLNVFLEKPISLELEHGEELIGLANNKGLVFMVGHVLRFMSPYEKLKRWTDRKEYGALNFLSMSRFSGVPAWGQWKEKQADFGSSGGALFDLLIHDIDFVHYLLGPPDKIESTYLPGALSAYDYVSAFWSYSDRSLKVKLEGGNTFHSNFPFQAGYMANFERASVLYTTLKPEVIHVSDHNENMEIDAEDGSDGFYNEIDYFYRCLELKIKPEKCMPESSLDTIRICYEHLR